MKLQTTILGMFILAATPLAQAAKLELSWSDPAKYSDFRASDDNQERYRNRVMQELEAQFRSEAEKLPADASLKIEVKNLDMAGEVEYFHPRYPFGIRVLRNVDVPSMTLSYELRAGDKVLKSGETVFNDMSYVPGSLIPVDKSPLKYEKQMIRHWYQHAF